MNIEYNDEKVSYLTISSSQKFLRKDKHTIK